MTDLLNKRNFSLFGGGAVLFLGANLIPILPSLRAKYLTSPQSWGHTVGVVQSCRVSGRKSSWWVKPRYSYTVAGKSYEGTRYQFDPMNSRGKAQSASASLVSGRPVMVYYEKSNPASSTLVAPSKSTPLTGVGIVFATLLIGGGIVAYKRMMGT